MPIMSRGRLLQVMVCLCLVSCAAGNETVSSGGARTSMSALPTGECHPAPGWLAARVEEALAVRGAALTKLYVGPATNLSGGTAEIRSEVFQSAWWLAAMIGVGARPEVAVWLVSGLKEGDPKLRILPADEVALRYSATDARGKPIQGDGREAVRSCVGTPPEP
jgi:hypothetical protein